MTEQEPEADAVRGESRQSKRWPQRALSCNRVSAMFSHKA